MSKIFMLRLFLILALFISINTDAQLAGFTLTGNPESTNGATWTYQQTNNGIIYDLKGILFKPVGTGKFPSVIVNHGTGGNTNPNGYSNSVCKKMVTWGYVCIAVNLTHSGQGAPCGSPGNCDTTNWGASNDNFLRAMKCWDILASLAYTDTNCIAAFGHSRGAFLTTGLLGTYPNKFKCAGHTAGGVGHPTDLTFPTTTMANNISKPYILHHGTSDNVVNITYDNNLDAIFTTNGVTHQYFTYSGYTHNTISQDSMMFERTKTFFSQHICDTSTVHQSVNFTGHSGVYFLGTSGIPISTTNYSNPNISGVVVRFKWNDVEPTPGNFNWSFVDGEISKAITYNKKVSLQPLGKPEWLDSIGAQQYYYVEKSSFSPNFGHIVSDVIPWDSTYVNRYKLFLQNLAAKYANNAVVTYVNAIGGNFSRGLPDTVLADTILLTKQAFWTAYNYNADTLGKLMNKMTDYYMSLFPKTPMWCSVDYVTFQPNASGQARNYLASIYTAYGIGHYPDRFGLFREDVSGCNPNLASIASGSHWYIMQQNPCRTGAQMLWNVQDGPARMNQCGILPNTKTLVFDSAVNKGLALGMRYLEVYGIDIIDSALTTSIQQANSKLIAKGTSCSATILPVKLIYFNGSCQHKKVILNWVTGFTANNTYYNVERSIDGVNWILIGKEMSVTGGTHSNSYTFIDNSVVGSDYYYRLRQVDADGKSIFSNVINISNCAKSNSGISVFPNPANEYLTFTLLNNSGNIGEISIINPMGILIKKATIMQNNIINIKDLPSGVYFIKFKNFPNLSTKFIKL